MARIMARKTSVKEMIDRAALELFVKQGVAETSIKDIARKAGVSQGAMYNHYASKEELAWTLWSENFSEIGNQLRQRARENEELAAKLQSMIRLVFERFDDDWVLVTFVFLTRHQFLSRVTPRLGNPYIAFRSVIADAIRIGKLPHQDIDIYTSIVTGAIIQVIDTKILGRIGGRLANSADKVAAACVRFLGG
jgi:AcrR family transcriptional regulator